MSSFANLSGDGRHRPRGSPGGERPPVLDYRELVDSLRQIVFQTDRDGNWRFLSASWPALTGFDSERSIGTFHLDYIHPKDRGRYAEHFGAITDGLVGEATIVVRFLTRDGGCRWMEVHASPVLDARGAVTGLAGTATNITDRIREEELLLANHRTVTGLINDLPGMVYRCRNNRDYTMEYVSAGARELTGYAPEDIINSATLSYGSLIYPDDQQQVWNDVQCGLRERSRFEMVYRIRTAKGDIKWVWERGKGIFSSSGELLGLEGFITDITARKIARDRDMSGLLRDPATGLATVPLFHDRLAEALCRSRRDEPVEFALMLVRLDRFQRAVRTYASQFTEQLMVAVARRLAKAAGPECTVARLREDQFGFLTDRHGDAAGARRLAQTIHEQFLSPYDIEGSALYLGASIGIVLAAGQHHTVESLLGDADTAMNRAHALGGGRSEKFDARFDDGDQSFLQDYHES